MRALTKTSAPATASITAAWASPSWSSRSTPATGPSRATQLGDLRRVGAEPVLDVGGDVDAEVRKPRDELDGPPPPSPPPRRAARAPRPHRGWSCRRRKAGRGEHRGRRVIPRIGQDERRAGHVEIGEGGHRAASITPAASARAWASPGQRRGPAPNGIPSMHRDDGAVRRHALRRGHRRRVAQHDLERPLQRSAHERRGRLAGLDQQRDALSRELGRGGRQRGEHTLERRVGAVGLRAGVVGGGDDADVRHQLAPARGAERLGQDGDRDVGERRIAQPLVVDSTLACARRSSGSSEASSVSTSARRRACTGPLEKRETVARSQAIVPNGPGGRGRERGGRA